jgi:hypothetical protein
MKKHIDNTKELLEAIKELFEERFMPYGKYWVHEVKYNNQTSITVQALYDTPEDES